MLAHVSDPGFRLDAPAWAARNGHSMLELVPEGPGYVARSLSELIASAQQTGVRLIACTMTMDLLGIAQEDLIGGVELGVAAMFFGEANESNGAFLI